MVIYKGKSYSLDDIHKMKDLPNFINEEKENRIKFLLPEGLFIKIKYKYSNSKERNRMYESYKVGFLRMMLSFLKPSLTVREVNDIIFDRYSCFKEQRTMEYLFALYKERKDEFTI